jgi:hypothetical protein
MTYCNDWSHGKFEVTNNTPNVIDSLKILPDHPPRNQYISLNPGETKRITTNMGSGATDGMYTLKFKANSAVRSQYFGYYSNGNSLEKLTKVTIMPDTVLFKFLND